MSAVQYEVTGYYGAAPFRYDLTSRAIAGTRSGQLVSYPTPRDTIKVNPAPSSLSDLRTEAEQKERIFQLLQEIRNVVLIPSFKFADSCENFPSPTGC
jgi:hypothetical protein